MIPVPFPAQPGDKLRVTVDRPYGTELVTGDLVTVIETGVWVEEGRPLPVVKISTAHGPQTVGFDAVEPYDVPVYTPGEPDDVVDAFFFRILGNDDELRDWAVEARETLAANDPGADVEQVGGGVAVASASEGSCRRQVGESYTWEDEDRDELEVCYFEHTGPHGREGTFVLSVNDEESVVIPATQIEGLLRFLFTRKKHSERPQE